MERVRLSGHGMSGLGRAAAVAAGAIAIAVPATAVASALFTQEATVKLTTSKAGKSTGLSASLHAADPGNPGGKPKALTRLTLKLPSGTRVDGRGVKQCNGLTNAQILTGGCPDGSKIGSGTAMANGYPLIPTTTEDIAAYATKGGVLFALTDNAADPRPAQTLVLRTRLSSRGVLKATVPPLPLPIPGQFAVLTDFDVKIGKRSRIVGGKRRIFVRTPKLCTHRGWTTTTSFRYADGTKATRKTKQSCRR
jgi:hypothetical protein